MRESCRSLTLLMLLTLLPCTPQAAELAGRWEGEILGGRRPFRAELDLTAEPSWTARLVLDGRYELEVAALEVADDRVRFGTNLNGQDFTVRLARDADVLRGKVEGDETPLTIELWRLPRYGPPASRAEAWAQDLEVVRTRFLRFDRSFSDAGRVAARKALTSLAAEAGKLTDEAIVVRLSEIVASAGNAHTRLYLLRNRTALRRMPVRLSWFSDGLHVVQATEAHEDLLGCRVDRIGATGIDQAQERVSRLFAGNASWARYKGPYFLTSPEILAGAGLVGDTRRIEYGLFCAGGARTVSLEPLDLERKESPTEAWRELSQRHPAPGWSHVLDADASSPFYLRHPDRHYWMEAVPENDLLYFQYNRSQDMPSGESLAAFGERLLTRLRDDTPRRLVIDLRFNTGGNSGIARDLFARLGDHAREHPDRRTYVVTGRATFSAGIYHAAQLASIPGVIYIGEPVGDVLDTWSEGGNLVLPNSGLTVHYTNGFHGYSTRAYPEREPFFADLDLPEHALGPHVFVGQSFDEYLAGVDPVLRAILGP